VAGLVNAFSPTALGFAGLLVLTGGIAAWRNIGSVAGLWHEPYGQILLAKLALLSVAAGTGAYNWKRVLPNLGSDAATARLRKSATLELAAALAVLVVTAVLVATPMPSEMMDVMAP
jgi:putative copper export protein